MVFQPQCSCNRRHFWWIEHTFPSQPHGCRSDGGLLRAASVTMAGEMLEVVLASRNVAEAEATVAAYLPAVVPAGDIPGHGQVQATFQLPHAPQGACGLQNTGFDPPSGRPGAPHAIYPGLRRRLP